MTEVEAGSGERAAARSTTALWTLPATELLAALRGGTVTAASIMESVLDRVAAVDPLLHAFVEVDAAGALKAAHAADDAYRRGEAGPLSGIPFSVKDLHPVRGMRTGHGRAVRGAEPETEDDLVVGRLRAAGAIPFGKTRSPEQGYCYSSMSSDGVAARTPWRLDYGAGGSSSGAAAAVAAGMGPLALGSDGGGSIRVPAALCGVVGLKPSFGRIPAFPVADAFTAPRVHIGPLARTVADAALFLRLAQGADSRDPFSWSAPVADGGSARRPAPLRLAWTESPQGGLPVDPEVAAITGEAARRLAQALGSAPPAPSPGWGDQSEVQRVLWEGGLAMRYPGPVDASCPDSLRRLVRRGRTRSMAELGAAGRARTRLFHHFREFFENWDVLLTPTCPVAGWPHDRTPGLTPGREDALLAGAAVYPFNLTGNPAITLPAGWTSAGLPVGLQLITGWRADALLLEVAQVFEQVRPWTSRRPVLRRPGSGG
ncbi:amidase [Amycolatopsis sp. NPDC058340]|uniref:amidase n=1 Tax=Amycolatopsis sp. NPDC058340 TaxID=3346453 RepID=UPI0036575724